MANSSGGMSSTDYTNLLGAGASLAGTGLGIYDANNAYSGLSNALKTIGPTALQGWGMNGPGGMSSGYNPLTGQANIGLGSLSPAFSNLANAGAVGSGSYNAGLPSMLSGSAMSTLNPALSTLFGAYGNYGAGIGAANSNLPTASGANFGTDFSNLFGAYQQQLQPQIQQSAYGLQNTLFGNGVADSTGAASGSLAEQNFGRGVGQATSSAMTQAFQNALQRQGLAASNYSTLSNSANGILANAFSNYGNTNSLISGLNTQGLTNANSALQGAGALNTLGLNNYNAALQTGIGQGTVRNQSLFPYASVATALAGQPTGLSTAAGALGQIGTSLMGNGGLGSALGSIFGSGGGGGGIAGLFGGAGGIGSGTAGLSPYGGGFSLSPFGNSGLNLSQFSGPGGYSTPAMASGGNFDFSSPSNFL